MRSAAGLVVLGALLSAPGAMLVVTTLAPQPAWVNTEVFVRHHSPIQALPYALGFVLLFGFVFFVAACRALGSTRLPIRSAAALVFTGIYAAVIFINYTLQCAYVPRIVAADPEVAARITMSNPSSLGWFLEMFGYAALGVATWLVAPLFGVTRRGRWISGLLVANGVASILGALCTAAFDRWVFSPSGLVSFVSWNLLVVVCFGGIAAARDAGLATPP